jgi:TetR/AcrR family transcriptional regulator, transcriptional repressor for nem operon
VLDTLNLNDRIKKTVDFDSRRFIYQLVRMLSVTRPPHSRNPLVTRQRLIDATVRLILRQGFTAATVDQICAEAGVTKGSFFHHFENKEAIGLAAANWWGAMGTAMYEKAWEDTELDPLEQMHRFLDIMSSFTTDLDNPCTCVVGMLSQEMSRTNPAIREVCAGHLKDWTGHVVKMLAAAKLRHPPLVDFDPERVGWFLNCLWQGSMLIAKTCEESEIIRSNIRLARNWVDGLFGLSDVHIPKLTNSIVR